MFQRVPRNVASSRRTAGRTGAGPKDAHVAACASETTRRMAAMNMLNERGRDTLPGPQLSLNIYTRARFKVLTLTAQTSRDHTLFGSR